MWNGNALQTTFTDSRQLQTTITQQTFNSFGGAAGSSVQISVRSLGSVGVLGCPNGGDSATPGLGINLRGFLGDVPPPKVLWAIGEISPLHQQLSVGVNAS